MIEVILFRQCHLLFMFFGACLSLQISAQCVLEPRNPDNVAFSHILFPDSPFEQLAHQVGSIRAIKENEDGVMWIAGEKGLVLYDGSRIEALPIVAGPIMKRSRYLQLLPILYTYIW